MTLKDFENSGLAEKWKTVVSSPEFQAAYYLTLENELRLVERDTQISSDKDVHAIGNGKMIGVLRALDFLKFLAAGRQTEIPAAPEHWAHKREEAKKNLPEIKRREQS